MVTKKNVVVIFLILLISVISYLMFNNNNNNFLGSTSNLIQDVSRTSTSTGSYCSTCPVKVLSRNDSRQYAVIQNISSVDMYLFLSDNELTVDGLGGTTATGSITSLNGIKLEQAGVSGDTYIIDESNLFLGYVYASSTAISSKINVTYK